VNALSRRSVLALFGAGCAAPWLQAAAQGGYPDKPLHILVPFPAGALTDNLGRLMAQRLHAALGQPVVVDNHPGVGTLLGASLVAKSPADGYSLLIATSTTLAISPAMYAKPLVTAADFSPVAMIGGVTLLLVTRPDFPAANVHELVEQARRHPGQYNFASPGTGTMHHLLFEMLKARQKIAMTHIPYPGSVPALTDVISGRVDFMFIDAAAGLPQIKAGRVKVIAANASRRLAALPDTPTLVETYPKMDVQAWQAVVAPKGTPAAIVQRLNGEINKALATPDMRATLQNLGVESNPMGTGALDSLIARDAQRFAELVRSSGAHAG
jgi:tripartite-type tricarboxylate transporter receptor subunit TctC